MADVRSGLNHASTEGSYERRQGFDGDHTTGVKVVPSGGGAFGAVDAADDRAEREGDDDRQVLKRVSHRSDPFETKDGQPFVREQGSLAGGAESLKVLNESSPLSA